MIPVGTPAPDFVLPTQDGKPFHLADYRGRSNVLIFFIPAAFTPICSTELPALSALQHSFQQSANTVVVVVTADHTPCNRAWLHHLQLTGLLIVSDWEPKGQVSQAYGAWIAEDGIPDRATVLVSKDGLVKYSESVGKFGKRSVPALLEVARAQDGRAPVQPSSVRIPLDLPVLLVTSQCPYCQSVVNQIRELRIEDRIVVRSVGTDAEAMGWLLSLQPDGSVPVLRDQGNVYVGAPEISGVLPQIAKRFA